MAIEMVLFDLDGVIRHFDPAHPLGIELEHGLDAGVLMAAAFARPLISQLVTGQISRAEWEQMVGSAVGSEVAAEAWLDNRGTVDWAMVGLVDRLREAGLTVAILTNGTDTVPNEMVDLGLAPHFDRVFSTSAIGIAKPDRGAFEHVCQHFEADPVTVFFTDDSEANLREPLALGMTVHHFDGIERLTADLGAAGVLPFDRTVGDHAWESLSTGGLAVRSSH